MAERRSWIEPGVCGLSVRRQCDLLGLHRSNVYYEPVPESVDELRLMRLIDEEYLRHPHLGSRGMVLHLARQGEVVNRKKMQRLLRKMGLQSLAPRPSTTQRAAGHKVYPYLLRGVDVVRPNQVWACDISRPMERIGRRPYQTEDALEQTRKLVGAGNGGLKRLRLGRVALLDFTREEFAVEGGNECEKRKNATSHAPHGSRFSRYGRRA